MKRLQTNFTTPEQSKHLLDLGLPEDSADCYFHENRRKELDRIFHCGDKTYSEQLTTAFTYEIAPNMLPCWSVGRLIELLVICTIDEDHVRSIIADITNYAAPVETYVNVITYLCKKKELDFSKLEE